MRFTIDITVLVLVSLFLLSCAKGAKETIETLEEPSWSRATEGKADIYGTDSRREINDPSIPDQLRIWARSVAMVFNIPNVLEISNEKVVFKQTTMSDRFEYEYQVPLCEDEPFAQQVAPGYCSAFLIAPDLVATAGHCVNGHTRCEQMGFAFGYAQEEPQVDPLSVPREDFYRCESVVGRIYNPFEEPEALASREYWYDWAVIKLDRPVTDRAPLKLAQGDSLSLQDSLYVLGHPSGLAMKVAEGRVVTNDKTRYFNTTLDIYQGNSGSPVFDEQGSVHGIVIRGSGGKSFKIEPAVEDRDACGRSQQCQAVGSAYSCIGNHALRIDPVVMFTDESLLFTERHSRVERERELGFRYSFNLEEAGRVKLVTLQLNAGAYDSQALQVFLHHEGQRVEMMHRPQDLPYGRWAVSSFEYEGAELKGEWIIEIVEEEGARLSVEWAQLMFAYYLQSEEERDHE